jgi:hypothetical protein
MNIMYVKHLLFQSKSEYHAGKQAQADRKYGTVVVRFDVNTIKSIFLSLLINVAVYLACQRSC